MLVMLHIEEFSQPEKVNKHANAEYFPPGVIGREKYKVKELIKMSGTTRLVDLGSGSQTINSPDEILELENLGFSEYVAVDMDIKNREFEVSGSTEDERLSPRRIKAKSMRREILSALHSFPDNYANACMTGLDSGIFRNSNSGFWGLHVMRELKRVVPEGGFIFTDGGFADSALKGISPIFREFKKKKAGKVREGLKMFESREDDLLKSLGKYCVDMPEIGFRAYFDNISIIQPMVIINTRKIKDVSRFG
jgi:hypothetical protein